MEHDHSMEMLDESCKELSNKEQDKLMKERIKEALDYVQKVKLYYQTLSVKKRANILTS